MKAYVLVREQPWYRREAFTVGLRAAGYTVHTQRPDKIERDDVLVIWNRYAENHALANKFEGAGARVLVAENGYCSAAGGTPKFEVMKQVTDDSYYAVSVHGHNGSGQWPTGDGSRFAALGVQPQPWNSNPDGHILVCGQRGIGSPTMASPPDWHDRVSNDLRKKTKRKVVVRTHPGNNEPQRKLDLDLEGAHSCVIWSSGSGVKALLLGIPVFYDAPHWICESGALPLGAREKSIRDPEVTLQDDKARLHALEQMSWAQWKVSELVSGEPFKLLLAR
jgi:hypothetical protein